LKDDQTADLQVFLNGPFVLRDDGMDKKDPCFRIMIPDVLDSHQKPGFTATNNAAELDNGVWTISFDRDEKAEQAGRIEFGGSCGLDTFPWPRAKANSAYAILKLPMPNGMFGIAPDSVRITCDTENVGQTGEGLTLATKAILTYSQVILSTIQTDFALSWHPDTNHGRPDLEPAGGVAILTLDMLPLHVPVTAEHSMMSYRNMAKMVGIHRFMWEAEPMTVSDRPMRQSDSTVGTEKRAIITKAKYNDCGTTLIFISGEPAK
jgi:hypothetical protein